MIHLIFPDLFAIFIADESSAILLTFGSVGHSYDDAY